MCHILIFAILVVMTVSNGVDGIVLDLAHGYLNHTTTCWDPQDRFIVFNATRETTPNGWYATESVSFSEHCGTHLDAPFHFNQNGWKLEEIPVERMIVEGVYVNISHKVNENPDFSLTADHLKEWETVNGPLPCRCVILVDFGWAHKYGDRESYYGSLKSPFRCPGLSKDAAQWIADSGKVYGVGVDSPSIDNCNSKSLDAHKILTKINLYLLENLALNGTRLSPKGFKLIVQPIKIVGGTGGPARVLAFTDNTIF